MAEDESSQIKIALASLIGLSSTLKDKFSVLSDTLKDQGQKVQTQSAAIASSSRESYKKIDSVTGEMKEGFTTGGQQGGNFESDVSELRSGRFYGIIERKLQGVSTLKDTVKDQFKKFKADSVGGVGGGDGGAPSVPSAADESGQHESGSGGGGLFGGGGGRGKNAQFNTVTIKTATIQNATFKGGPGGMRMLGGGGMPSPGGGGGEGEGGKGGKGAGETVSSAASIIGGIQIMGFSVGAIAGFVLKMVSSMAAMRQQFLEAQESTSPAVGLTTGYGGYWRSSEAGRMALETGRVTGRTETDQGMLASQGGLFGVGQGIGATKGAVLHAQLRRFGLSPDKNDLEGGLSGDRWARTVGAAEGSGFQGLRRAEYVERIARQAESSYMGGYGQLDIRERNRQIMGLTQEGGANLRPENAFDITSGLDEQFRQRGSMQSNLALASRMGRGESYMTALVGTEKGAADPMNLEAMEAIGKDLDPETRALWEMMSSGGRINATQAMQAQGGGGVYTAMRARDVVEAPITTSQQLAQQGGASQTQIENANVIDDLIRVQPVFQNALELQSQVVQGLINVATPLLKGVDGILSGLTALINRFKDD